MVTYLKTLRMGMEKVLVNKGWQEANPGTKMQNILNKAFLSFLIFPYKEPGGAGMGEEPTLG